MLMPAYAATYANVHPYTFTITARRNHLIAILELHNLHFGGFVHLLHGYILLIDDLIYAQVR